MATLGGLLTPRLFILIVLFVSLSNAGGVLLPCPVHDQTEVEIDNNTEYRLTGCVNVARRTILFVPSTNSTLLANISIAVSNCVNVAVRVDGNGTLVIGLNVMVVGVENTFDGVISTSLWVLEITRFSAISNLHVNVSNVTVVNCTHSVLVVSQSNIVFSRIAVHNVTNINSTEPLFSLLDCQNVVSTGIDISNAILVWSLAVVIHIDSKDSIIVLDKSTLTVVGVDVNLANYPNSNTSAFKSFSVLLLAVNNALVNNSVIEFRSVSVAFNQAVLQLYCLSFTRSALQHASIRSSNISARFETESPSPRMSTIHCVRFWTSKIVSSNILLTRWDVVAAHFNVSLIITQLVNVSGNASITADNSVLNVSSAGDAKIVDVLDTRTSAGVLFVVSDATVAGTLSTIIMVVSVSQLTSTSIRITNALRTGVSSEVDSGSVIYLKFCDISSVSVKIVNVASDNNGLESFGLRLSGLRATDLQILIDSCVWHAKLATTVFNSTLRIVAIQALNTSFAVTAGAVAFDSCNITSSSFIFNELTVVGTPALQSPLPVAALSFALSCNNTLAHNSIFTVSLGWLHSHTSLAACWLSYFSGGTRMEVSFRGGNLTALPHTVPYIVVLVAFAGNKIDGSSMLFTLPAVAFTGVGTLGMPALLVNHTTLTGASRFSIVGSGGGGVHAHTSVVSWFARQVVVIGESVVITDRSILTLENVTLLSTFPSPLTDNRICVFVTSSTVYSGGSIQLRSIQCAHGMLADAVPSGGLALTSVELSGVNSSIVIDRLSCTNALFLNNTICVALESVVAHAHTSIQIINANSTNNAAVLLLRSVSLDFQSTAELFANSFVRASSISQKLLLPDFDDALISATQCEFSNDVFILQNSIVDYDVGGENERAAKIISFRGGNLTSNVLLENISVFGCAPSTASIPARGLLLISADEASLVLNTYIRNVNLHCAALLNFTVASSGGGHNAATIVVADSYVSGGGGHMPNLLSIYVVVASTQGEPNVSLTIVSSVLRYNVGGSSFPNASSSMTSAAPILIRGGSSQPGGAAVTLFIFSTNVDASDSSTAVSVGGVPAVRISDIGLDLLTIEIQGRSLLQSSSKSVILLHNIFSNNNHSAWFATITVNSSTLGTPWAGQVTCEQGFNTTAASFACYSVLAVVYSDVPSFPSPAARFSLANANVFGATTLMSMSSTSASSVSSTSALEVNCSFWGRFDFSPVSELMSVLKSNVLWPRDSGSVTAFPGPDLSPMEFCGPRAIAAYSFSETTTAATSRSTSSSNSPRASLTVSDHTHTVSFSPRIVSVSTSLTSATVTRPMSRTSSRPSVTHSPTLSVSRHIHTWTALSESGSPVLTKGTASPSNLVLSLSLTRSRPSGTHSPTLSVGPVRTPTVFPTTTSTIRPNVTETAGTLSFSVSASQTASLTRRSTATATVRVTRSVSATASNSSTRSITLTVLPVDVNEPFTLMASPALQAAAVTAVLAASVSAGGSVGDAGMLAALSMLPCSGHRSWESNSGIQRFAISPFYDLGPLASVWGSIGLVVAFVVAQLGIMRMLSRTRRFSRSSIANKPPASIVRYPSLGYLLFSFLLPGILFASVSCFSSENQVIYGSTASVVTGVFGIVLGCAATSVATWYAVVYVWPVITPIPIRRTLEKHLPRNVFALVGWALPMVHWTPATYNQQFSGFFSFISSKRYLWAHPVLGAHGAIFSALAAIPFPSSVCVVQFVLCAVWLTLPVVLIGKATFQIYRRPPSNVLSFGSSCITIGVVISTAIVSEGPSSMADGATDALVIFGWMLVAISIIKTFLTLGSFAVENYVTACEREREGVAGTPRKAIDPIISLPQSLEDEGHAFDHPGSDNGDNCLVSSPASPTANHLSSVRNGAHHTPEASHSPSSRGAKTPPLVAMPLPLRVQIQRLEHQLNEAVLLNMLYNVDQEHNWSSSGISSPLQRPDGTDLRRRVGSQRRGKAELLSILIRRITLEQGFVHPQSIEADEGV